MFRFHHLARSVIALTAILTASGCQSSLADSASAQFAQTAVTQQLIIKFKPANAERLACDADGIARLAAATGSTLDFVRVMSGAACVVRQRAGNESDLIQAQRRIKRHPAIDWLEPDAVMKAL